ncbi:MAG TPA: hypothetical protein DCM45_03825 [Clostridiales bacterium]|nr:hypothetical protein [Clostridiales bacterium]
MSRLFSKDFVLVLLVLLLLSLSGNMMNSPLPVFAIHIGADNTIAGLVTGLFALSSMFSRPLFGWLLDKKGRRIVLILGVLAYALVTFSFNWVGLVSTLLLVRFVQGFAMSAYTTSLGTMAADLIPTSQLVAGYGYYSLLQTLATSVGPAIGLRMAASKSFNGLFTLSAAFAGAGLLAALLINYEKKGMPIVHHPEISASGNGSGKMSRLFEKTAISVTAAVFFLSFSTGAVMTFLSPYAISNGVNNIGLYFTANAVAIFAMRLILQKIIGWIGLSKSAVIALAFVAGSMLTLSLAQSIGLFIVAAILNGIGCGIVLPIFNSLIIQFCPPHRRGAASATYYIGIDSGIGAGAVLGGIITKAAGYPALFMISVAGVVIAFAVYAFRIRYQYRAMAAAEK